MTERPVCLACERCGKPMFVKPIGPLPLYCGRACRSRAYEERKRQRRADEIAADLSLKLMDRYGVADGAIVDWVREQALGMGRLR